MASRVAVNVNFRPLKDLDLSTRELMQEVGLLARERIYLRTIGGRDENGQMFKPYSKDYAKAKAKEVGLFGVNLQLSGEMLNAMTIAEVTDDSVTLGFSR